MSLPALQSAIIDRLRDQVAAFSDRVAGAIDDEQATAQTEFALPNAFVLMPELEPGEVILSPLDVEYIVRFRVLITASNAAEERGQTSSGLIDTYTGAVVQALMGHTPASGYSPIIPEDRVGGNDSDRRAAGSSVSFRTTILASDL